MKKNRNYNYQKYDHKDYYRDNILYGKEDLDETEKMKDITFGTNDNANIDNLDIINDEEKKQKRKESVTKRLKRWFKNNKGDFLFWFITTIIIGGIITLFGLYFSHNTDIAVINNDIDHIKETINDLKGNKKISDEDYNSINSKLIQIENQVEISQKDIEIIYKEINYIKDNLEGY